MRRSQGFAAPLGPRVAGGDLDRFLDQFWARSRVVRGNGRRWSVSGKPGPPQRTPLRKAVDRVGGKGAAGCLGRVCRLDVRQDRPAMGQDTRDRRNVLRCRLRRPGRAAQDPCDL